MTLGQSPLMEASASVTLTLPQLSDTLPPSSRHSARLVPSGNALPLGGVQITVGSGSQVSVMVGANVTTCEHPSAAVLVTMVAGQVTTSGTVPTVCTNRPRTHGWSAMV